LTRFFLYNLFSFSCSSPPLSPWRRSISFLTIYESILLDGVGACTIDGSSYRRITHHLASCTHSSPSLSSPSIGVILIFLFYFWRCMCRSRKRPEQPGAWRLLLVDQLLPQAGNGQQFREGTILLDSVAAPLSRLI
jgi:hypothetical protein